MSSRSGISLSGFTFWKCLHCLHILASPLWWNWSTAGCLIQGKPSLCSQTISNFSWITKENGDICLLWCHFLVAETVTEALYINVVVLPNVTIHLVIKATLNGYNYLNSQSVPSTIPFHVCIYILAALQPISKCHCLYYYFLLWATVTCTWRDQVLSHLIKSIAIATPLKG